MITRLLQGAHVSRRIQEIMDSAARLDRLRRAMAESGIDLLAIPPGDDLKYLTGFSPHADERPCYLFIAENRGLFLVPDLNANQSEKYIRQPFVTYSDAQGPARALAAARDQFRNPRKVGVGDTMRADAVLLLQDIWRETAFIPASTVLAPLRMRKAPDEIAALRRVAATADAAIQAAIEASKPGTTERQVAVRAGDGFLRAGANEVAATIVGSGPNSAFPHHQTSDRTLKSGEPVLFDLGSKLEGYCSDITRMVFLGKPSARYVEVHKIVNDAVQAALGVIRPGTPIKDVDLAARRVIERAEYGDNFTHRTGHGVGLSVHEPPSITHTDESPLEQGMAFSVEPGIYLPGEFGVRLEEIVVVTESGTEVLSKLSRDLRVIG